MKALAERERKLKRTSAAPRKRHRKTVARVSEYGPWDVGGITELRKKPGFSWSDDSIEASIMNAYILTVVNGFREIGFSNDAVTAAIYTNGDSKSVIREVAEKLYHTYTEYGKDYDRIYSIISMNSEIGGHQNWIIFNHAAKTIVLAEPNGRDWLLNNSTTHYGETLYYRDAYIANKIVSKVIDMLDDDYEMVISKGILTGYGTCKAASNFLGLMHAMRIEESELEKLGSYYTGTRAERLEKRAGAVRLIKKMEDEIKEWSRDKSCPVFPRTPRSHKKEGFMLVAHLRPGYNGMLLYNDGPDVMSMSKSMLISYVNRNFPDVDTSGLGISELQLIAAQGPGEHFSRNTVPVVEGPATALPQAPRKRRVAKRRRRGVEQAIPPVQPRKRRIAKRRHRQAQ